MKVIKIPQCNEWSDIGLMVVNTPVPEKYSTAAQIPTWWELYASRSHGVGSKGGGQGKSREVTAIEGIQPP